MTQRRVVITGMGAVSAAGFGWKPLWDAAKGGMSLIGPLNFSRPYPGRTTLGARVPTFDVNAYIDRKTLVYCDVFTQYAIIASDEAIKNAQSDPESLKGPKSAIIVGTGIGGVRLIDEAMYNLYTHGQRPEILSVPKLIASAAPSMLSMRYGVRGPIFTVSSACSSANQSIGMGMHMVRNGLVEQALVGGTEASISVGTQYTWELLKVLTPDKCRPFSKGRNGMSVGDGAAFFLLETEEAARQRNAPILCYLDGYGTSSDAYDPIRPSPDGAAAAMNYALEDAGTSPDDIDYVNAHGTATALNDPTEAEALGRIFGDRLAQIPVSSTKPVHGHGLGAAGALELVCAIAALREGIAPPTINFLEADPKCAIDCVPNVARPHPMRAVMSNSFAFGGINASLVIKAAS